MEKDFDGWNSEKKNVHGHEHVPLYHTREIWWAKLGLNVGFEQDGASDNYKRPVLVLRGLSPHVCIILPLTTSDKRDRYYIDAGTVADKSAAAIISQIRLVDTRRLVEKIGMLDKPHFDNIRKVARAIIFN